MISDITLEFIVKRNWEKMRSTIFLAPLKIIYNLSMISDITLEFIVKRNWEKMRSTIFLAPLKIIYYREIFGKYV
jgi:hypothetical protein